MSNGLKQKPQMEHPAWMAKPFLSFAPTAVNDGTSIQKILLFLGIPLNILISICVGCVVEPGAGIALFIFMSMMMGWVWDGQAGSHEGGHGLD